MLACCCLLLIGSLAFFWRRKLRAAAGLSAATVALILFAGSGVAPRLLLPSTRADSRLADIRWTAHNSIVLLGAGTVPPEPSFAPSVPPFGFSRVAATAAAYDSCRRQSDDCRIIVSGGDPERHGASEAAIYADALQALQVPGGDLQLEEQSRSTWENALYATRLVPAGRTLVVVTSGVHLERALLAFSHFRRDVRGLASDRPDVQLRILPTATNLLLTDMLVHERIGILRYAIATLWG